MDRTGFAVVGAQNFAAEYISRIRSLRDEGARLTGVVISERKAEAERARELRADGFRIYDSYEELLRTGHGQVDVICLPVSIPAHADLSVAGMAHGYDVLLEKPPAPTVGELDAIRRTSDRTGNFCSIGFQHLHAPSIRRLKRTLLDGTLGELESIACKGCWPRSDAYYDRNPWAGKLVHEGDIVLDGPVNNAFAHFLQNMLFLAGDRIHGTASLAEITAERYRANPEIQAADIACVHATTECEVDLGLYVTHASAERRDPHILVTGTDGTAEWHYDGTTTIQTHDGQRAEFDNEGVDLGKAVFRATARYQQGVSDELYCTPDNTRAFVVAVDGSFESSGSIVPLPDEAVHTETADDGAVHHVADGIEDLLNEAFTRRALLSEIGLPWAESRPGVDVTEYTRFTPFA
ncbi:Gfo/Idh/MocA family protein [Halosimplex pelagicum]|uniref:Gfo/Idh/MocA family oxidoreductase n=1 Tax=Halosimplex pelagicum TaxID=869886 RepID=A0A7D5T1K1_9EURY|nr:Gfo/Idh/MocA family oxidoreductase [Halosimplex pelagicum]QLH80471.1 Gfo/Idh/MocA family oxidoreductase [Halosimplex pelagicum]